jgi:hypothetical protein
MTVFRGCSSRVSNRCFSYAFLSSCLALPELEQSQIAQCFNLFYLCEIEGIDCSTSDYCAVYLVGCCQCMQGTWCLSSGKKMEVACSSKSLVTTYQTLRHYKREGHKLLRVYQVFYLPNRMHNQNVLEKCQNLH